MRFTLSFLVLVFVSACASTPPANVVKAPVVGFVRALKINDEPVPGDVCFLWFGKTKVPLREGAFFTTDLPVGPTNDTRIACDRGFFQTDIVLKIDQELNVQANSLNLLAEYSIKLATERNALGMALIGGQVTGRFNLHPMSRESVKKAVAENPALAGLKQTSAIKFDYLVGPQ